MGRAFVLVRGAGDLASGAALRLHRVGFSLLLTEIEHPLAIRRSVSFSEAVYDGVAEVEGVIARRASALSEVEAIAAAGEIAVLVDPSLDVLHAPLPGMAFPVAVDARLSKLRVERLPVPFIVGLGPGFFPGENCHAAVETMRGHTLGRVYWDRPAAADTGLPEGRPERVLRAPAGGILHPRAEIGDLLAEGDLAAEVQTDTGARVPVPAGLGGVLRGMLRPGTQVAAGWKIGDIDPRGDPAACLLVSDKALAVGGGVLEAVLSWPEHRRLLAV